MQIVKLIFWLFICQIPAWIGAGIVHSNMTWYHGLQHPLFSPPDWLFSVVWAILYIMLGASGYYLTRQGCKGKCRKVMWIFIIQLALNALWSPLFFGMHAVMLALLVVTAMLALTFWLLNAMKPISRAAMWLMIPYAGWLCFAWLLNCGIWVLN